MKMSSKKKTKMKSKKVNIDIIREGVYCQIVLMKVISPRNKNY